MEQSSGCQPVPAPRRLYPELRKNEYENVTVDSINKNLNINTENLHILTNCNDKLPNNKIFLSTLSVDDENNSPKSILTETNDLYGPHANENVPIYATPTPAPRPRKPNNSEASVGVPEDADVAVTPVKHEVVFENNAGAPNASCIYENTTLAIPKSDTRLAGNLSTSPSTSSSSCPSPLSGAKPIRKAPELPPKTYLLMDRDRRSVHRLSANSDQILSNSCHNDTSGSYDFGDSHSMGHTARYDSNGTLNSSLADSNESSENHKFKSPSPGYVQLEDGIKIGESFKGAYDDSDVVYVNSFRRTRSASVDGHKVDDIAESSSDDNNLLKTLGATSKLLTESIGERVVSKAKGAKSKLDKNFQFSTEFISNIGHETTNRLKNASKQISTKFTPRKERDLRVYIPSEQSSLNSDRPQTLPPNDQIFTNISFSSPLNKKVVGMTDLSVHEMDNCYEVPRGIKLSKGGLSTPPPSYEMAITNEGLKDKETFSRAVPMNRSLMLPKHMAVEAANIALSKQISSSQRDLERTDNDNDNRNSMGTSNDSLNSPSPPMPNFPPPALPQNVATAEEGVYGKLKPIQAPARLKRRKNYEQIQLRRVVQKEPSPRLNISMRPNVDSAELEKLNMEMVAAEQKESIMLLEKNKKAEDMITNPQRSDSWEFYADRDEESAPSSPEPLYANQEATYGKVFEMATSNMDLLPAQSAQIAMVAGVLNVDVDDGALGAVGAPIGSPKEIIQEFDPLLLRKASTICKTDKSNQLLLLEHMLQEYTYGEVQSKSDDDISVCTSDEDNLNTSCPAENNATSAAVAAGSTPKTVVLPTPKPLSENRDSTESSRQLRIVHQNARLLSDSMENMVDDDMEKKVKPFLSRVDSTPSNNNNKDVDLSRPSQNRSIWFVPDSPDTKTPTCSADAPWKFNIEDGESPPTYLEAICEDSKPNNASTEQKSRAARFMNSMNVFSNVKSRVDALKRKGSFMAGNKSPEVRVTLQMVPRPCLSPLLVRYEGPLIRFPSGVVEDILKDMQNRKAIFRDRHFQTYLDHEMKTLKESIPLEYVTTLQCVSNSRVTDNATHFYCFEITMSMPKNAGGNSSNGVQSMSNPNLVMTTTASGNCKHQRICHLYGVSKESERGVWMQKLLEGLTNTVPSKYLFHYYRAGWCYLKHSITSEWSGTWLVLKKTRRRLIFVTDIKLNVEKMDLRKARCIILKESDESINNLHVETGPTLMIDCPPFTVYIIMNSPRETKIWRHIIREVAHNNGFGLNEQQLTKFNVPVIVDKCINFVYIHGSMSEGIYRKSGSENSILKLMAAFRADAFNVEITRNEYNEHDVANVLKRFMRDLPVHLMGKHSDSFICVTELLTNVEKIEAYKELIARLSTIERETLKKIIGHLSFISSQKAKNKMGVKNISLIWGPTLLQNQAEEMIYSQKEAEVITDLISLYKNLFPLSVDEYKREQVMLSCLQKYYAAAETLSDSVKQSGDIKLWIQLKPNAEDTTEELEQVSITLNPTKTAYDVCKELVGRMGMPVHSMTLFEVILNGDLERPLHHDCKVFDVVLNWSYWPECDRKNNYLMVKTGELLVEVHRAIKNLATITPGKELKFVDNRTKAFKSFHCELRDGKIVISKKDKNEKTTIVREVFLQSSTAYLGCEKKRDFPWSWAITFVERNQTQIMRSRESPFIGHVLAGAEWVDRTIWYSSIWWCLFGDNILPPAELIIK